MLTIHPKLALLAALKKLLRYSWSPIDYIYDQLTQKERDTISRSQFEQLVQWLKDEVPIAHGPLTSAFTPRATETRPVVTDVIDTFGEAGAELAKQFHYADWSNQEVALQRLGALLARHPSVGGTVLLRWKVSGAVLHVLRIEPVSTSLGMRV